MVANMREFTVAIDQVGNRYGTLPTAESPAMRELSDQQQYARRSTWRQPITETHGLGELTLRAAADYVRSSLKSSLRNTRRSTGTSWSPALLWRQPSSPGG